MNLFNSRRALAIHATLILLLSFGSQTSVMAGGPVPINCSEMPPEQAAVRLFEYIEEPNFEFGNEIVYRTIFSERLLSSSPRSSVDAAIRSSTSTYQDIRTQTPLPRRLAAPPTLLQKDDPAFNKRGDATVRILSLSTRGRIEQRMSISCEKGAWKVESFSYGSAGSPSSLIIR